MKRKMTVLILTIISIFFSSMPAFAEVVDSNSYLQSNLHFSPETKYKNNYNSDEYLQYTPSVSKNQDEGVEIVIHTLYSQDGTNRDDRSFLFKGFSKDGINQSVVSDDIFKQFKNDARIDIVKMEKINLRGNKYESSLLSGKLEVHDLKISVKIHWENETQTKFVTNIILNKYAKDYYHGHGETGYKSVNVLHEYPIIITRNAEISGGINIEEYNKKLTALENKVETLEQEKTNLTLKVAETQGKLSASTEQNEELKQEIETLKEKLQEKETQIQEVTKELNESKKVIEQMEENKKSLEEQLAQSKEENQDLKTEIENLNQTITEKNQKIQIMEEQLKNAQDTIEEQSKKIDNFNQKISELEQKLAEKDKYIKELEELKATTDSAILIEKAEQHQTKEIVDMAQEAVNKLDAGNIEKKNLQERLNVLKEKMLQEAKQAVEKAEESMQKEDIDIAQEKVKELQVQHSQVNGHIF